MLKIPPITDRRYTERSCRPKGYSGPVSILVSEDGGCTRRVFPGWSKADHLKAAKHHAERSYRFAKAHGAVLRVAERKHGRPSSFIAGGVAPHFPAKTNNKLRAYAQKGSSSSAAAYAHCRAAGKQAAACRTIANPYGKSGYSL